MPESTVSVPNFFVSPLTLMSASVSFISGQSPFGQFDKEGNGGHNDDIKELLDSKNLKHTECVMYRTVSNDFTEEEVANFDYDMLVFFSPVGVDALTKNFPDFKQKDIVIATFGPATARAVKEAGLRLDLEAPTEKYPSMTGALQHYLLEHEEE